MPNKSRKACWLINPMNTAGPGSKAVNQTQQTETSIWLRGNMA